MTGAGNDFVLIDERAGTLGFDWPQTAPGLCHRRYGVGADGLLVLRKSRRADFLMLYFNADGTHGGMCGNGGRCAAWFVLEGRSGASVTFEAVDYLYRATVDGAIVHLEMKDPSAFSHGELRLSGRALPYHFVDSGTAHAVVFLDELGDELRREISREGIVGTGRSVRIDPAFAPGGTNVDFVSVLDNKTVTMRTYERGVEDETLACGTGAVASAVVAALERGAVPPIDVRTQGGETLRVGFRLSGTSVSGVTLSGSARLVFCGEFPAGGGGPHA